MKRFLFIAAIISFSFILTGCPYDSEVAIDNPASVKYPAALLGNWEPKSSSDEFYKIKRKDDFVISIIKTKKNAKAEDTPEEYEAFLSEVDGVKFLNLYEKSGDNSTPKFYLYKLEINNSGTKITLSPLTENIDEKFQTSAELKAFIKENMKHSFFFDKEEEVFIKAD